LLLVIIGGEARLLN